MDACPCNCEEEWNTIAMLTSLVILPLACLLLILGELWNYSRTSSRPAVESPSTTAYPSSTPSTRGSSSVIRSSDTAFGVASISGDQGRASLSNAGSSGQNEPEIPSPSVGEEIKEGNLNATGEDDSCSLPTKNRHENDDSHLRREDKNDRLPRQNLRREKSLPDADRPAKGESEIDDPARIVEDSRGQITKKYQSIDDILFSAVESPSQECELLRPSVVMVNEGKKDDQHTILTGERSASVDDDLFHSATSL